MTGRELVAALGTQIEAAAAKNGPSMHSEILVLGPDGCRYETAAVFKTVEPGGNERPALCITLKDDVAGTNDADRRPGARRCE